jgi:hypothetical protein
MSGDTASYAVACVRIKIEINKHRIWESGRMRIDRKRIWNRQLSRNKETQSSNRFFFYFHACFLNWAQFLLAVSAAVYCDIVK